MKKHFEVPKGEVISQIIQDLKEAQSLLPTDFVGPDGAMSLERVRPNKVAAMALLARVYLYQQQWDSAEVAASFVINAANYNLQSDLNEVFKKKITWKLFGNLSTRNDGYNTADGGIFLSGYNAGGPSVSYPISLSYSLVNTFEPGDLRKQNWVDSLIVGPKVHYYPFKYKLAYTGQPPAEYTVVLRLAEQYLIRAEARAHLNNLEEAKEDINAIRIRAGLQNTPAEDLDDILAAVMNERKLELFTEYGHRWFDLKRTGEVNNVMSVVAPLKGGEWSTTDELYPLPSKSLNIIRILIKILDIIDFTI